MSAVRKLQGYEWAALAALAAWVFVPLAFMLAHAAATGARLTGADGIIGADQLQYLAWARDAGAHGLASNLFELTPSGHVYAQPMFTLTGFAWRLGVPLQIAYWVWKPIAMFVLWAGAAAWVRQLLPDSRAARGSALALCLFFATPLALLIEWANLGSSATRNQVLLVAGEMFPAGELWGYLPSAIAVGLMPVALLAIERAITRGRLSAARGPLALAAAAAALASWLHPWQGITLLLILGGLAAWGRMRDWRALAVPAAAGTAPLVYYLALSKTDSAWKLASNLEIVAHPSLRAVLVGLVPPVALALAGLRRPGADLVERAVLLWFVASVAVFVAVNSFPSHALESTSFPLAVLGVRGWRRLSRVALRARPTLGRPAGLAAGLTLAAATLPLVAYGARDLNDRANGPFQEYYLTSSDSRALNWVAHSAPPGGVLAPLLFAIAIPSQTGRPVWVGHQYWSRDFLTRARASGSLFSGQLSGPAARALVTNSGARLLVADCAHANAVDLTAALRGVLTATRRFGCATVYELAPQPTTASRPELPRGRAHTAALRP